MSCSVAGGMLAMLISSPAQCVTVSPCGERSMLSRWHATALRHMTPPVKYLLCYIIESNLMFHGFFMDVSMFLVQQTKVVKRVGGRSVDSRGAAACISPHSGRDFPHLLDPQAKFTMSRAAGPYFWGLSLLKVPTNALIIRKLLLRHYAKFKI